MTQESERLIRESRELRRRIQWSRARHQKLKDEMLELVRRLGPKLRFAIPLERAARRGKQRSWQR